MIDDFTPSLRLDVTAGRVPLKMDVAAATDPKHLYVVISEDGKLAVVFAVPIGCNSVSELLRMYGLPRDSLVLDIGPYICIDIGDSNLPH
jgi:hypothetical protein